MSKHHVGARRNSAMTLATLIEYGTTCHLCLRPGANTRDHIIPLSRGGLDVLVNCRPAHHRCNAKRGNRPLTPALLLEFRPNVVDVSVDASQFFESTTALDTLRASVFSPNRTEKTTG